MKFHIGDLVRLNNNLYHGNLVGIVVAQSEEDHVMYGGGVELHPYVDVQWFNKIYGRKTARFSPGIAQLEILSSASDTKNNT